MSKECKCEHNNHGHFFLWMCIFLLGATAMDCMGSQQSLKNRILQLEYTVATKCH